jgi:PIN domain nuclease of toxin-antitoxin system
MPTSYVVDAHALIWFFEGSSKLGTRARVVLEDPSSILLLPAIALAEACWLIEKGRSKIGSVSQFLTQLRGDSRISVDPRDADLIERSCELGWDGEMHDRQVVATAVRALERGQAVSVLTTDAAIRNSGLVSTVW